MLALYRSGVGATRSRSINGPALILPKWNAPEVVDTDSSGLSDPAGRV